VEMEMNNLLLSLRPIRQVHCCRWKCFLSSFLCTFYTCLEFPGFCEQAKQQNHWLQQNWCLLDGGLCCESGTTDITKSQDGVASCT
jgi:hypothetical protein